MNFDRKMLTLYAVTDRAWLNGGSLVAAVSSAIRGGATCVQLREKSLAGAELVAEAEAVCAMCRDFDVPFIVNDDVALAVRCGADGVHVGQHDLDAKNARARIGANKILGVSAQTVEQALAAERAGADYLGVGAVFSTATKFDADAVSFDTLRRICDAVDIPVVAIGGITVDNLRLLSGSGIAGVAVVSAIFAAPDICAAARELATVCKSMIAEVY